MTTATKTTQKTIAATKSNTTTGVSALNHMQTMFTSLTATLGADRVDALTESSETFGLFLNGGYHLAKIDDTTANLLTTAIHSQQSVTSIYVKLRNTDFDGIVTKEGVLVTDPDAIAEGNKARERHGEMFNSMSVIEKMEHIEQQAREAGTTPADLIDSLDKNKLRGLFGLTVGCPTLATLRAGYTKELKTRLARAVKAGNITQDQADELLVSYKVDKESKSWVLAPVVAKPLDEKAQAEKEAKEKAAKLEKLINAFCELDGADQVVFLKTVGTHSHEIADLIIAAGKGFEAQAKEDAAKVELDDQEAEMIADFRELAREMEQIDKGNKKLTAAQKRKAKAEFTKAKKALEDRGVDTSKL